MAPVITITTDFGTLDAYVASMKGVILGVNPNAAIVDISHDIRPQDIRQAAFVVGSAWQHFPPGAIHVIVVDPGVGSNRQAVIVKTPAAYFVAPDNGVVTYAVTKALEEAHLVFRGVNLETATQVELGESVEAVVVTNKKYWRHPVSQVFHGRDIFAPVAAHLSLGVPLKEFGEPVKSLTVLPLARSHTLADGTLVGSIIHVDRFGNLITTLRASDLGKGDVVTQVGKHTINGLSRFYAEGEALLVTCGSEEYLEIAFKNGSARDFLNASIGDEVKVRVTPPEAQAVIAPKAEEAGERPSKLNGS